MPDMDTGFRRYDEEHRGDCLVSGRISYARSHVGEAAVDGGSGPDTNLDGGFP
jgi:hypothetical protein